MKGKKKRYGILAAGFLTAATLGGTVYAEEDWRNGIIEDQTFQAPLSEYSGDVWFASYAPEEEYGDVALKIIQDGSVVEKLEDYIPGKAEWQEFSSLDAVSFVDYNEDGNTDILIIKTFGYITVSAVYEGTPGAEHNFTLRKDLSLRADDHVQDMTIAEVLAYLKSLNGEHWEDVEGIPGEMAGVYVFASGVGAWSNQLDLAADGSFTGSYSDSDYADAETYQAVRYYSNFSGRFEQIQKLSDCVYRMYLADVVTEGEIGDQEIVDQCLNVRTEPYGITADTEYYLYLPGAADSEMPTVPEAGWAGVEYSDTQPRILNSCVLYNAQQGSPFVWISAN